MNSKLSLLLLTVVFAGLSGCASMSGDECMTSDWSAIGYEDGARGYTTDRLGKHRKACAKHGVTPDFSAYQSGRDQGLVEYCQPGRGFSVGVNGGSYNGVCSISQEANFLDAYNAGYHLYSLRSRVNNATSSIATLPPIQACNVSCSPHQWWSLIFANIHPCFCKGFLVDPKHIPKHSPPLRLPSFLH